MQAGFQATHWAQLYPPDAVTALAVNTEWELYVFISDINIFLTNIYTLGNTILKNHYGLVNINCTDIIELL